MPSPKAREPVPPIPSGGSWAPFFDRLDRGTDHTD